jgi:hypothetical protein
MGCEEARRGKQSGQKKQEAAAGQGGRACSWSRRGLLGRFWGGLGGDQPPKLSAKKSPFA